MDDTQSVKKIDLATVTGSVLPGSAISFPRVASLDNQTRRQSLSINSLSPTTLRIGQTPPKGNQPHRFIAAVDQTLTRFDAQTNPISSDKHSVGFSGFRSSNTTLAEFTESFKLLCGWALANNGANITAMYNGEE